MKKHENERSAERSLDLTRGKDAKVLAPKELVEFVRGWAIDVGSQY